MQTIALKNLQLTEILLGTSQTRSTSFAKVQAAQGWWQFDILQVLAKLIPKSQRLQVRKIHLLQVTEVISKGHMSKICWPKNHLKQPTMKGTPVVRDEIVRYPQRQPLMKENSGNNKFLAILKMSGVSIWHAA